MSTPQITIPLLLLFLSFTTNIFAKKSKQIATITKKIGPVKILSNPSKEIKGKGPHVLYDGLYYKVKKAKRGDTLDYGNVIQTGKISRARLIYENGDQISLGRSSSYKVTWNSSVEQNKPVIDVLFGTIRATIMKGGDRSDLKVKTKSMTMGVRGTDFHVYARGKTGGSQVSVLRGIVAINRPSEKKAKPIEIPAGFSADIPETPKIAKKEKKKAPTKLGKKVIKKKIFPLPKIVLRKTTKQDLIVIQKSSKIRVIKTKKQKEKPVTALDRKIALLEKKAVETVIQDIKLEDPALYEKIKKDPKKIDDVDQLQTITVKKAFKEAPIAKKPRKPGKEDLLDIGDDVYDKYFDY